MIIIGVAVPGSAVSTLQRIDGKVQQKHVRRHRIWDSEGRRQLCILNPRTFESRTEVSFEINHVESGCPLVREVGVCPNNEDRVLIFNREA